MMRQASGAGSAALSLVVLAAFGVWGGGCSDASQPPGTDAGTASDTGSSGTGHDGGSSDAPSGGDAGGSGEDAQGGGTCRADRDCPAGRVCDAETMTCVPEVVQPDSGADSGVEPDGAAGQDALEVDGGGADDSGVAQDTGTLDAGGVDVSPIPGASCFMTPPPGSPVPVALKPYSGGTCPVITSNYVEPAWNPTGSYEKNGLWESPEPATENVILSSGNNRRFYLIVPPDYDGSTPMPVVWTWHWLKSRAWNMVRDGELMYAVKQMKFIAIVPEALRNASDDFVYTFTWPFPPAVALSTPKDGGKTGSDAEITFVEDVLACVAEQYNINTQCLGTMGVSAGALWSSYLATLRGESLSSVLSLSGGYSGTFPAWQPQAHKYHALVLWGGCKDMCVLDMAKMSQTYVQDLTSDGHFVLECVHPCQHGVPPVPRANNDINRPKFELLWHFFLHHPFWLMPGESPYLAGLPDMVPVPTAAVPDIGTCGASPSQCSGSSNPDYTNAHVVCKIATGPEPSCDGTWK